MRKRLHGIAAPAAIALALAGVASVVDGAAIEPNTLKVNDASVPIRRRGAERLEGVRLAHLSDLHVTGRGWKPRTLVAAIEAINRAEIDLVAITGDFLGSPNAVQPVLEMLAHLRTDVPRVAVYGNHDHVYGERHIRNLSTGLDELGIRVLNNDAEPLELGSGSVWVVGVNDAYSYREDLDRALSRAGEASSPRILLTHYPDLAERLRPGQVDLSLAGHSHGGQIRIPLLGTLMHKAHARTNYGKGLFMVNENPLYVSSGIGMSGIPMRFLNPPEVPIIEFVADYPFARNGRHSSMTEGSRDLVSV